MAAKKITYTATAPDGREYTRTSAKVIYTHARAIRSPFSGGWQVISWHKSQENAEAAPFAMAKWKTYPCVIVAVTSDAE